MQDRIALTWTDVAAIGWGYNGLRDYLAGHPEQYAFTKSQQDTRMSSEKPGKKSDAESTELNPRETATRNPDLDAEPHSRVSATPTKKLDSLLENRNPDETPRSMSPLTSQNRSAAENSESDSQMQNKKRKRSRDPQPTRKRLVRGSVKKGIETVFPRVYEIIKKNEFFGEERVTWLLRFVLYLAGQGVQRVKLVLDLGPQKPSPQLLDEMMRWGEGIDYVVEQHYQLQLYTSRPVNELQFGLLTKENT